MKKYLKIGLASFVLLIALGVLVEKTFAKEVSSVKQSFNLKTGVCYQTTYYSDLTKSTERGTIRYINGTMYCDIPVSGTNTGDGIYLEENSPIEQSGVVNPFGYIAPKLGEKNNDAVRNIQTVLLEFGIPVVIDGNFGPRTKAGITEFQTKNGLMPSGLFDSATRELMEKKLLGTDTQNPAVETSATDIVSLKNTTTTLEKIKNEITSLSDTLSKLAQQASAIMATLPK